MDQIKSLFFASVRKYSLDFDENSAFISEFLIAFGILLKVSAALFLKILEFVVVAICGAEFDLRNGAISPAEWCKIMLELWVLR